MDGEIDLELYTISIIRLNSIFQKIEDKKIVTDIISDINDCFNDLNQIYEDILNELSKEEININEYDPFFENGMVMFPEYTKSIDETIGKIDDENLKVALNSLSDLFVKLIKVGNEYFEKRGAFK
ncbi:hypothetical protein SAMN05216439_1850 [Methanobrevibacter gottschalkii]|uniref:Uncharacterized protein n=2 Tax=Methanobrevibacter gottschalkii TaxID=190974 RepID=A0A3N5BWM6_9EURY|nr:MULTISPECIES: hypothetical protein [Methanobrevibacter]MCQ2971111.1 hypothetical protein [archaeon]OEC99554.1 hypothetical protein A9505_00190 [Methanobrevibacter sp. A27]RPF51702.1 hypothetical protein EDC42_1037 [Methanobrevibacter gottschalkii DSM 11977]SEL03753.1 hypothetical protein SAMN05216439_1850 [Methanobrevibacter gottschalkii]